MNVEKGKEFEVDSTSKHFREMEVWSDEKKSEKLNGKKFLNHVLLQLRRAELKNFSIWFLVSKDVFTRFVFVWTTWCKTLVLMKKLFHVLLSFFFLFLELLLLYRDHNWLHIGRWRESQLFIIGLTEKLLCNALWMLIQHSLGIFFPTTNFEHRLVSKEKKKLFSDFHISDSSTTSSIFAKVFPLKDKLNKHQSLSSRIITINWISSKVFSSKESVVKKTCIPRGVQV